MHSEICRAEIHEQNKWCCGTDEQALDFSVLQTENMSAGPTDEIQLRLISVDGAKSEVGFRGSMAQQNILLFGLKTRKVDKPASPKD